MADVPPIESERLSLRAISAAGLEACLNGDVDLAARWLDLTIPPDWSEMTGLMRRRLEQLREDPALAPWLVRAIGLRQTGAMIGHLGFHTAPNPDYLQDIAPGGVEIGYTVYPAYRRQGYASEACEALMTWAYQVHAVRRFVLSISPTNEPSLRIARHFGFQKVGSQMDEEDGPEDIFVLEMK